MEEFSFKFCIKCLHHKPITLFSLQKSNKDGRQCVCKECISKNDKERNQRVHISNGPTKICTSCGKEKLIKEFGKRLSQKDGLQHFCSVCSREKSVNRSRNTKLQAIKYLGSKCSICGYDKCIAALEFHHKDPNEKEFDISKRTHFNEAVKNELQKCVLLCSNCHREAHFIHQ